MLLNRFEIIKSFLAIWSILVYFDQSMVMEQIICDCESDSEVCGRWKGEGYVSLEWTPILIGGEKKIDLNPDWLRTKSLLPSSSHDNQSLRIFFPVVNFLWKLLFLFLSSNHMWG